MNVLFLSASVEERKALSEFAKMKNGEDFIFVLADSDESAVKIVESIRIDLIAASFTSNGTLRLDRAAKPILEIYPAIWMVDSYDSSASAEEISSRAEEFPEPLDVFDLKDVENGDIMGILKRAAFKIRRFGAGEIDFANGNKTIDLSKFRAVVETSPFASIMMKRSSGFIFANSEFKRITGYDCGDFVDFEDFTVKLISRIMNKSSAVERFENAFDELTAGETLRLELNLASRERKQYITDFFLTRVGDETFFMQFLDITNFALRRKQLLENEEKFRLVFDNAPIGILVYDVNGRVTDCNQYHLDMLGAKIEDVIGFNMLERLYDKQMIEQVRKPLVGKRGFFEGIYISVTGDKEMIIRSNFAPVFAESGSIKGAIAIIENISKRRQAELELQQLESKYRAIVEKANEGILIIQDFIIKYCNPKAEEISGFEFSELIEKNILYLTKDEDRRTVRENYEKRISGDTAPDEYLIRMKKKSGSYYWANVKPALVEWEKFPAVMIFVTDVSDGKAAEEQIRILNKELETRVIQRTSELENAMEKLSREIAVRKKAEREQIRAKDNITASYKREKELNELKSKFISMISHEYRTPLTIIMTSTYLLEKLRGKMDDETYMSKIKMIQAAVENMTDLLENVIAAGKAENARLKVKLSEVDIVALCRDMVENAKKMEEFDHKINFYNSSDSIKFTTDVKRFKYIIGALLANAVKFSPKGTEIKLAIKENKKSVSITLEDKGIGIPKQDWDNIFQPFRRGENIGVISGLGLGLPIVKNSAESLGGKISFKTVEEKGTLFKINLPKKIAI